MRVTDKNYSMEPKLKEKLDIMILRMTKKQKDNLIIIDGDEGDGKTNMELGIAYYIHHETGRPFSIDNVFFDLDKLIDFGMKTKEQIICWDEGALGGLSAEWWNKNQKRFIKFLMIARKKRHFFIICIPRFFKLNEYFVIDRSIALIHVYLRHGTDYGRFVYFNEVRKERLWQDWKRSKYRNYKMHYLFHGSFPHVENIVLNKDDYEKKKDEAILNMDNSDKKETKINPQKLIRDYGVHIIANIKKYKINLDLKTISTILDQSLPTIGRMSREANEKLGIEPLAAPIKSVIKEHINNTLGMDQNNQKTTEVSSI